MVSMAMATAVAVGKSRSATSHETLSLNQKKRLYTDSAPLTFLCFQFLVD